MDIIIEVTGFTDEESDKMSTIREKVEAWHQRTKLPATFNNTKEAENWLKRAELPATFNSVIITFSTDASLRGLHDYPVTAQIILGMQVAATYPQRNYLREDISSLLEKHGGRTKNVAYVLRTQTLTP